EERKEFDAALERLQAEQQKLRERTEQLLDKMDNVAQERQSRDPQTAKEMKDAAQLGRDKNIAESMRDAQQNLNDKQPSKAVQKEQESVEKLQDLVKQLEDRREAEL